MKKRFKVFGEMEGRQAHWYARQRKTPSQLSVVRERARGLEARLAEGARVLEVAMGPGLLSVALARSGRLKVTGLDVSRTMVEIARQNAAEEKVGAEFLHGDVAALPFEAGQFDLVVCQAAFKNFTEPRRALDEMYRVLKPGGHAEIDDLAREASRSEIADEVRKMELSGFNAFTTRFVLSTLLRRRAYSRAQLEQLVAASAFKDGQVARDGIGFTLTLSR